MKKNISVNLFGTLYAIDEDAYDMLEEYLNNMKRYFGKKEGGEEIADDIEHRVAELLAEKKQMGMEAISIDVIKEIMQRIGNPEEMDELNDLDEKAQNEGTQHDAQTDANTAYDGPQPPKLSLIQRIQYFFANRSLYRDPNDKILGGVISGFTQYIGGTEALPLRILAVIVAIASFMTFTILYLIAWVLIPEAQTSEDRLRMQGKPINPQTLNEELMQKSKQPTPPFESGNVKPGAQGCLGTLLKLIVVCFKLFLLFILASLIISILSLIAITPKTAFLSFSMLNPDFASIWQSSSRLHFVWWVFAISSLVFLSITLYAIIRSFITQPSDKKMSGLTKATLSIIAVLALATSITSGIVAGIQTTQIAIQTEKKHRADYKKANTINGIYLDSDERTHLKSDGWNLATYNNVNDDGRVYYDYDFLDDLDEYLRFERANSSQRMEVDVYKDIDCPAGDYYLRFVGYAKGDDCYAYVKKGSSLLTTIQIPRDDAEGYGNMATYSVADFEATGLMREGTPHEEWDEHIRKNIKQWSFVRSIPFHHDGGKLSLGVTNLPERLGKMAGMKKAKRFGVMLIELVPASESPKVPTATAMDSTMTTPMAPATTHKQPNASKRH